MSGTFFGFNTALRGLFAQQKGMNTTAHNISNANTPGFSRQQVVMETTVPFPVPSLNKPGGAGQLGTGVDVAKISRIRDNFLDKQIRKETESLGRFEEQWKTLGQVETIFMEPSETGLANLMDQFWSGWNELSKNAENSPIRTTVKELSLTLADTLNHLARQLNTIRTDINQITDIRVKEVNSYAEQIANLNTQIASIQGAGDQPNDLKDRRDALLDQLAKVINYSYTEDANTGMATIELDVVLSDGSDSKMRLVDGTTSKKLGFDSATEQIYWDEGTAPFPEVKIANGQLKGLADTRDLVVNDYLSSLNDLASTLAEEVNNIHKGGYDLSGIPVNGTASEQFFEIGDPAKAAETIRLNPEIDQNVALIAASADTNAGDGSVALRIYELSRTVFTAGPLQGTTLNNHYKDFTSRLGVTANTAKNNEINQQALVEQLTNRKESVSGVSIDEEMANMIQYQRSYEAAAKIISTLDEMLQTIINDLKR